MFNYNLEPRVGFITVFPMHVKVQIWTSTINCLELTPQKILDAYSKLVGLVT